jgi:hypothetical protein
MAFAALKTCPDRDAEGPITKTVVKDILFLTECKSFITIKINTLGGFRLVEWSTQFAM